VLREQQAAATDRARPRPPPELEARRICKPRRRGGGPRVRCCWRWRRCQATRTAASCLAPTPSRRAATVARAAVLVREVPADGLG
jgi:hypothetical protein